MQIRLKPKTYGPLRVHSQAQGSLVVVTEAGNQAIAGPAPAVDALSPSDLLLASLGTCIAISLRMAAKQMELDVGELELSLRVTKALDPPNRFARFEVQIHAHAAIAPEQVDDLLARTKQLCTVSNTLGAIVELSLASREEPR